MIQIISSTSLLSYSAILFGLICVTSGHSLIYLPGLEVGQTRDILHQQELPLQQSIDSNQIDTNQLDNQPSLMRILSGQSTPAAISASPNSNNRSPQPQAAPSSEHTRRILDDKLGILRESVFTTNNHLGHKGVPKSGSDEVF